MNKSELVELIAEKADISKAKAALAVDAFTAGVADALAKGDEVALVGFGTFTTAKREARKGRNPATGKEITIAAATLPKFRPGKALKDAVKQSFHSRKN
jgi:DNA-binding protein HU-beta